MKRGWLGIGLLALLLLIGIALQLGMDSIHGHCAQKLEQAADAALREDWDSAVSLAQQAYESWKAGYSITAAVADHAPMDEVDRMYAELGVYARRQETVHFAASCAQLAKLTQAVAEAHRFSLRNLL